MKLSSMFKPQARPPEYMVTHVYQYTDDSNQPNTTWLEAHRQKDDTYRILKMTELYGFQSFDRIASDESFTRAKAILRKFELTQRKTNDLCVIPAKDSKQKTIHFSFFK